MGVTWEIEVGYLFSGLLLPNISSEVSPFNLCLSWNIRISTTNFGFKLTHEWISNLTRYIKSVAQNIPTLILHLIFLSKVNFAPSQVWYSEYENTNSDQIRCMIRCFQRCEKFPVSVVVQFCEVKFQFWGFEWEPDQKYDVRNQHFEKLQSWYSVRYPKSC